MTVISSLSKLLLCHKVAQEKVGDLISVGCLYPGDSSVVRSLLLKRMTQDLLWDSQVAADLDALQHAEGEEFWSLLTK